MLVNLLNISCACVVLHFYSELSVLFAFVFHFFLYLERICNLLFNGYVKVCSKNMIKVQSTTKLEILHFAINGEKN